MDTLPEVLYELLLYGLVALAFLGPVEAFLRFRQRRAVRRHAGRAYLPMADPWVTLIVALAGAGTLVLVSALS
ncbi:MAG TPA: hypothetical protein VHF87_10825 [Methylomirabilota bacterium]|jgi:hypothetical protein|nr:hypothetical protein [Methylomirabilota bacterium]